ncbi:MAG: RNA polymerase sigma factor [Gemmatimonadota bacterium]
MAREPIDQTRSVPDDTADAHQAARGDLPAFERLYGRHVARIHSLCRRMLDADLADEVTQDVFVRTWEKLGTFRGDSTFGTWLHRLAVNVILARRKRLGIRRERFAADGEAAIGRLSVRPAHTELAVDFEAGIERLPPGARQVLVLHDVEGYKHAEIAELLGVTTGTTKAQLHRARMMMREYLST